MKVLFTAFLAAALASCTAAPHPGTADRRPTASKFVATGAKSIAPRKTKTVAKAKRTGTTSPSAAAPAKSDPVADKAKAAIAAMLENPSAAEFYKLHRAQKNLLQRRVDTICGYVKAKGASGRNAGGMPFLYIVGHDRDDEAYLVNGTSHVSETVHRALCR